MNNTAPWQLPNDASNADAEPATLCTTSTGRPVQSLDRVPDALLANAEFVASVTAAASRGGASGPVRVEVRRRDGVVWALSDPLTDRVAMTLRSDRDTEANLWSRAARAIREASPDTLGVRA